MFRNKTWPLLTLAALVLALSAGTASGDEPRAIVVKNDGKEIVIDMEAVDAIVDEALEGMADVLAELEDMQIDMHLGRDNRLNLSYEDTTFELDLDQIMAQVGEALESGLSALDTADWTDSRVRWEAADETELKRELQRLREEMAELKKELKRELNRARDDHEDIGE